MIVPIGTSRLHEAFELGKAAGILEPTFLGAGYFHCPGQALNLIELGTGRRELTTTERRRFFRRDQTRDNPFDTALWDETADASVERIREGFASASAFVIEISSLRSYFYGGLYYQGNPNADRNVPYAEVWREGYYHHYEPGLGVHVYDATVTEVTLALESIKFRLGQRPVIVVPHLVGVSHEIPVRRSLHGILQQASEVAETEFISLEAIVDLHGFRVLDDGTTDIHHLPTAGCRDVANLIAASLRSSLGPNEPTRL